MANDKSLWQKFVDTMNKELADLSYIEIITASGDPKSEIDPNNDAQDVVDAIRALDTVKALARTRIELDGDIALIVPGGSNINQEILSIHKQNVDVAVANWNAFVQNMLRALDLLISIVRGTPPNLDQLIKDVAPITGTGTGKGK